MKVIRILYRDRFHLGFFTHNNPNLRGAPVKAVPTPRGGQGCASGSVR
jgi:hypothetical protein